MADQVVRLGVDDFEDTMAMMARAFSEWGPHDFPRMYPALYRPTAEVMQRHFAVRRAGHVVAAVGVMPLRLQVGDVALPTAGIGGVATDPECRGEGLMTQVMEEAVLAIRREGYALSYLGGHRQRYRRFGWEVAGTDIKMQFDARNVASVDAEGIRIVPLAEEGDDVVAAKRLHDARIVRCHRSAGDFRSMLCNWEQRPHAAYDASNRLVGYLSVDKAGATVNELVGADAETAGRILAAWVRQQQGFVTLWVDRYDTALARRLGQFAQYTTTDGSGNWQIFDWPRTVGPLWQVRCREASLPEGSLVLGVEGLRANLRLTVDGDRGLCETTDASPDLSADAATMIRVLFGPAEPSLVLPITGPAQLLHAWCPLPLALPGPDRV